VESPAARNPNTAATAKDSSAGRFSDIKNTESEKKQKEESPAKVVARADVMKTVYGNGKPGQFNESADSIYTPIKALNTFLFDWKIKARVTKKHAKKSWKNSRSEGTLLNVELIDNQGSQI